MSDKGRLHELTVAIRVALSGYKKDMNAVKAETAKVRDAVSGETQKINRSLGGVTTAKAQQEIDKLNEQIGRQKEKISTQEAAIAKLKRGYEDLVSGLSQDRSTSGIEKQLKSTEKEFEKVQKKLFDLYDAYEIAESTANTGGGTAKMSELSKEIDSLEPRYEQLGRLVQALNLKLEQVHMNPEASSSAQDMAARIEVETQKLERMKREAATTKEKLDAVMNSKSPPTTSKKISEIIARIKEMAKSAVSSARQTSNGLGQVETAVGRIGKKISSLVSGVLVFNLLRQGISSLRAQISNCLKTNNDFSASLSTVKTNLQVSFAAVYQAVLPALNALMRAVAAVTTAFAVMVSSLFGSSYSASLKAAQGIQAATKAVNGYSAAADAAQSFSFDETHNISKPDSGSGTSGSSDMMEMPEISGDTEGTIAKIKEQLKTLFEPMRTSWDTHGESAMSSASAALEKIRSLCKNVWKSFGDVWKNGTGVTVCSTILGILESIFDTVGNIADGLDNAWNFSDTGTQILQGLFDILIIILDAIARCAEATAEWSAGLDFTPIMSAFNGLLQAIQPIISTVCDGLVWMYQNVLLPYASWTIQDAMPAFFNLLSAALRAVNAVLNAFQPLGEWLWNSFLQPLAAWTGGVICDVLSVLAELLDGIGSWISTHQEEISGIGLIVAEVAIAVGLVTGAITIYNAVGAIAAGVTTAFGTAVAFLTSPIGLAIAIVTALIAVGVQLYQNWDTVKAKASAIWTTVKTTILSVVTSIKTGISTMLTTVSTIWDTTWTTCKTTVVSIFDGIWSAIKNVINSILGGIESMCNAVIDGINVMINALNKISFDIPSWVPGLGGKSFGFNLGTIEPVSLPRLAQGGIVDRATALIAGEAGREAIVPLENNTGWLDMVSSRITEYIDRKLSGIQGGAEGMTFEISIPVTLELDGESLLKKLIRVKKRIGPKLTAEGV
ncbi:MAG: hypothetical protein NC409_12625 [Clostridium sp.]|nr:hypothetical protein [Clostridium sp.]